MNSKERVYARINNRPVDRIPNLNILMFFAAKEIGVPYSEYCQDYRKLVQGNIVYCMVPMDRAAELYGDATCINGNYDPVAVLLQGSMQDVKNAVKACTFVGGKKHISSAGCEVPKHTPPVNLMAIYEELVRSKE